MLRGGAGEHNRRERRDAAIVSGAWRALLFTTRQPRAVALHLDDADADRGVQRFDLLRR